MKIKLTEEFKNKIKSNNLVEDFKKDTGLELDSIMNVRTKVILLGGKIVNCFVILSKNGKDKIINIEYGEVL